MFLNLSFTPVVAWLSHAIMKCILKKDWNVWNALSSWKPDVCGADETVLLANGLEQDCDTYLRNDAKMEVSVFQ